MLFFESLTQPSKCCSCFRFKGLLLKVWLKRRMIIYSDSYQQIFEKFQNIKKHCYRTASNTYVLIHSLLAILPLSYRDECHAIWTVALWTQLHVYFLRGSWWFHFVYSHFMSLILCDELAVLQYWTNDYMWLSYTVLWGEKWCKLTHTIIKQWRLPKLMKMSTKRDSRQTHTCKNGNERWK